MIALIDADVLVYQSAFGAQKTRYSCTYKAKERVFESAKDRDDWLVSEGLTKEDVEIKSWQDILSEAACMSIAKNNLQMILDALKTTSYKMYLTGKGNFREEIAVTKPYKGNRQTEKPIYFEQVKDYYTARGAITVDGLEADDLMAIRATKEPNKSVICTIDKDLNMVPGLHYNWSTGDKFKVNKEDGNRFFLYQLIQGDTVDNIPGIPKCGEKKAREVVDAFESTEDRFKAVYDLYLEKGFSEDYLNEQARLLWIKRSIDEPLWTKEFFLEYAKT